MSWVLVGRAAADGSHPRGLAPEVAALYEHGLVEFLLARDREPDRSVLEEVQVDSVASGATSEAYHLVVEDAAGITRLWADVVPEGWTLHQCDDSNDVGEWDGELCGG